MKHLTLDETLWFTLCPSKYGITTTNLTGNKLTLTRYYIIDSSRGREPPVIPQVGYAEQARKVNARK